MHDKYKFHDSIVYKRRGGHMKRIIIATILFTIISSAPVMAASFNTVKDFDEYRIRVEKSSDGKYFGAVYSNDELRNSNMAQIPANDGYRNNSFDQLHVNENYKSNVYHPDTSGTFRISGFDELRYVNEPF